MADAVFEISELLRQDLIPPRLMQYYDFDSDDLIEEKLRVLRELKSGKDFDEIPGAYGILEDFPGNDVAWD